MNKKIKAIIFDFDGVIGDTFEFHKEKVEEFTGAILSKKEFKDLHNGNFYSNKRKELEGVDWHKYQEFISHDLSKLKIQKKIKDHLLKLSKRYLLFIVSSGSSLNINHCLINNDINKIFKDIVGIEFNKSKIDKFKWLLKEYNLDKSTCVFITDTLGDVLEANKFKINTVAVDFGFHSKTTLRKGEVFKIISDFSDIEEVVNKIKD